MRLMEILKEAQAIEKDMVLTEASKESIKKKYNADKSQAFKMIRKADKPVTKSKAVAAVKDLDVTTTEIRNEIVAAFMKGGSEGLTAMKQIFNDTKKSREAIDYMVLLKAAHGGEKKMYVAAGNKKAFLQKVYAIIDDISDIKLAVEEDDEKDDKK